MLSAHALAGLPEIAAGADLAALIAERAELREGDVLAIAHKAVSKAEGRVRRLAEVTPGRRALELAAAQGKDPRQVQAVLDETAELLRAERGVLICVTRHGFVCANAGVDASNAEDGTVILLPADPDASARALRARLRELTGVAPGVAITDSFGRAWRHGQTDVAIGAAGIAPLEDWRGRADGAGRELRSTWIAVADQLAAAADLARGKDSRQPAVLLRGLGRHVLPPGEEGPGAAALLRPASEDLFRRPARGLGARCYLRAAMGPEDARFPAVAPSAGHYESFYLKCGETESRRGLWLRYTVHKPPGEAPVGSMWATLFDDGPHAAKLTPGPERLGSGGADWVRIGDGRIGADGCSGSIPDLAAWDLRFSGDEPPFPYLPSGWMYRARLPRTKALSLRPAVRVSGTVTVRGRTAELDGWPGMIGHNWGAEHAERWIWLHGTAFEEDPDAWLDATIGRIKIGPWTTPWVANGCLSLDGIRHRLGGIGRTRAVRVEERPEGARFTLPGDGIVVRGDVSAPRAEVVGWIYSDPAADGIHHTAHCAIADMTLTVERDGHPPLTLAVRGGATYELGMREQDHGIPIQPFSDP